MRLAFLLFLLGCFGTVHAGWFGPKNYDECILESMKGVTLKEAVRAIQDSCAKKFPDKPNVKSRELMPWELAALTGNAGPQGQSLGLGSTNRRDPWDKGPLTRNPWDKGALTRNPWALESSDSFTGNIYNGNKAVTVTQLSIVVTTRAKDKLVSRTYVTDVDIAPQSTGYLSFTFIPEGEFESWRISGARGH